jgi:hypothetical protein
MVMGVREGPDPQVCTRNLVPTTEILVDASSIFGQCSRSHDAWRFSVEQSEILNPAHIQENEVLLFLSFETEITRGDVQAKRKKRRFPSPLRLHRDSRPYLTRAANFFSPISL